MSALPHFGGHVSYAACGPWGAGLMALHELGWRLACGVEQPATAGIFGDQPVVFVGLVADGAPLSISLTPHLLLAALIAELDGQFRMLRDRLGPT